MPMQIPTSKTENFSLLGSANKEETPSDTAVSLEVSTRSQVDWVTSTALSIAAWQVTGSAYGEETSWRRNQPAKPEPPPAPAIAREPGKLGVSKGLGQTLLSLHLVFHKVMNYTGRKVPTQVEWVCTSQA